jgi:hypothetical protein
VTLRSLIVCSLFLAASSLHPQGASPDPGQLRWIRGTVTSVSPSSMTLQLRDDTLTLDLEPGMAPPVGARLEVHYSDRRGQRRAVLILDAGVAGTLSRRPWRSFRGTVDRLRRGTVSLRVEGRRRDVGLDSRTTLLAVDGRALASGRADVAAALTDGEPLLVIYVEQSDDMMVGDVLVPGSTRKAREIRRLSGAPALGATLQPEGAATDPGHLHWVRGVVTASAPESVTLSLRGGSLTLAVNPDTTARRPLAAGAHVDAHFVEQKEARRAVMLIDSNWLAGALSSRPGRSYRGTIDRVSGSTLWLRVDGSGRDVHLDSHTVLFDAAGRALATGRAGITAHLSAGEPLLVSFDDVADDVLTSRRAREIRKLR